MQKLFILAVAALVAGGATLAACTEAEVDVGTERAALETFPPQPPPWPQCSNGIDDDGDGRIDFPNDRGCDGFDDNDETDNGSLITNHACGDEFTANGNQRSRLIEAFGYSTLVDEDDDAAARARALAKCQDNSNFTAQMHGCTYTCAGPGPSDRCQLWFDLANHTVIQPCTCEKFPREGATTIVWTWQCTRIALLAPNAAMGCKSCLPVAPPPRPVKQE